MVRGRMKYTPPEVLAELENIKADHGLVVEAEAFRKMAAYAQLGREVERIRHPKGRRGFFL